MTHVLVLLLLLLSIAAISHGSIRLLIPVLKRKQLLDIPNQRSNHTAPTPRGAGIVLIPLLMLSILVIAMLLPPSPIQQQLTVLAIALLVLCVLGWRDDIRALPARIRLLVQAICTLAMVGMLSMHEPLDIIPFLPAVAEYALLALAWLWFTNLTNFMDGIDGITSAETLFLHLSMAYFFSLLPDSEIWLLLCIVASAIIAGFVPLNWHKARIFLGDSGSIPLGFLTMFLLVQLVLGGQLGIALILPAYFVLDATFTLYTRWRRGEVLSEGHSLHFYQRALRRPLTHAQVVERVMGINTILLCFAIICWYFPALFWVWVVVAYGVCFTLMTQLLAPVYPLKR